MAATVGVAVELTGTAQMQTAVTGLFKGLTDSANKMNAALSGPATTSGVLNQYFLNIKNATSANREHGASVNALTTLYHVLHPALSAAGIQIGELRSLSVAARLGFEGFGAAVGIGLVYALGKFSDSVETAKTKLSDLVKSREQGQTVFKAIEADAKSLGVTFNSLEPAVSSAIGALQKFQAESRTFKIVVPPGQDIPAIFGQGFDSARKAVVAFFEALRTGGANESQAFALTKQFFDKLQENSTITPQLVLSLKEIPGAVNLIAEAFGQGSLNVQQFAKWIGENPKTIDQLIAALIRMKPAIDVAFNAGTPDKFQTALNGVWTAAQNLGRTLAQSDVVLGFLEAEKNGLVIIQTVIFPAIKEAWNATIDFLKGGWTGWKDFMVGLFSGQDWALDIFGPLRPAMETIINFLKGQWMSFLQFLKSNPPVPAGAAAGANAAPGSFFEPGIGGFAGGGLFRGRGGVDTNLAWLTHGEYVIPRHAVERYGVQFLEWIRTLQFPIRGFAEGGLNLDRAVGISSPSISSMQSSRSLTLVLDTKRFNISGSKSTIDALEREATMRGISAVGLAPGWVR